MDMPTSFRDSNLHKWGYGALLGLAPMIPMLKKIHFLVEVHPTSRDTAVLILPCPAQGIISAVRLGRSGRLAEQCCDKTQQLT